jgi:hypothetical protein
MILQVITEYNAALLILLMEKLIYLIKYLVKTNKNKMEKVYERE